MSSVLPSEIPSPPPAVTTPQQVQCLNELERYAALMAEQEEREPSTAAPSVRSALGDAVFASSQGTEQEDMDLDRDKRRASEEAAEDSQSKPTCAKGEAKGDPKGSEQPVPSTPASTGKGRTAAPQTLPGQRQSGVASTTAPAEGTVDHRRRQRTQRQWGDQTWWGKDKRDHRSGIREDRFHDRDNSELRELVKAMFIIFMQTKEAAKGWSITASLYKVAQAWHKQKKEAPATLTQPLRTILFHCFLTSLRSRLQEMEENQELLLKAKELGLIEAQSYLYLTWSQEEKKYIKDSMDPLDHVDAVRMLNLMIQLSSFPDTVGRFHALRPLSAEHRSEVLPFLLEIQSRTPEANQLYLQLRRLCRNGALHLIGATMRPSKIGRSPLALQVDRLLQSL